MYTEHGDNTYALGMGALPTPAGPAMHHVDLTIGHSLAEQFKKDTSNFSALTRLLTNPSHPKKGGAF